MSEETPVPAAEDIPDDENRTGEPIADKGVATRPLHGTDDAANGVSGVPGVDPDKVDELRDESVQELDFETGRIRDESMTQGKNVIEAEFEDRGPVARPETLLDDLDVQE